MTTRRFAVRRLNPFAGVAEVVTTREARALSMDGRRWEIQVLAEAPSDCWGSLNAGTAAVRFFRFGVWTADKGLSCVPINPIMDVGAMLSAADGMIAALTRHAVSVPFALEDNLEHWLLDHQNRPLALTMSASPDEDWERLRPHGWIAAPTHDRNLGQVPRDGEAPIADDLERLIRRTAKRAHGVWLRREAPGRGTGIPIDPSDTVGPLHADDFPRLPVRNDWPAAEDRALVQRWIDRTAPRLLCLPYLDPELRTEIQASAAAAAVEVSALWRLYPEGTDPGFVNAARVEAALRRASDRE